MMGRANRSLSALAFSVLASCGDGNVTTPDIDPVVYRLPVVVHVIHQGEPIGTLVRGRR